METNRPFVHVGGLNVTFPGGIEALRQISFDVPRGQFISIVGPSGCGKSTLLRVVAGLIKPGQGVVAVDGAPPGGLRGKVPRTSFVFQDPTLLPWRSVAANVSLPLELLARPGAESQSVLREALQTVGLADFARSFPSQLSGGMRMRASLARAFVTSPELVLLDEPFAALDDITRHRLNEDLLRLWRQRGWTTIFVTHNIGEAVFLSQRVLVMSPRPGKIVADVPIPLSTDRTDELRYSAEFARLCGEVTAALRRSAP